MSSRPRDHHQRRFRGSFLGAAGSVSSPAFPVTRFGTVSGRYLDSQNLDNEIPWRYMDSCHLDSRKRVRATVRVRVFVTVKLMVRVSVGFRVSAQVRVRVSYDCPVYDCPDFDCPD